MISWVNKSIFMVFLLLSVLVFVIFSISSFDYYVNIQPDSRSTKKNLKYILYWTKYWNMDDFAFGFGSENFKNCRVKNCFTTNDKTLLPVDEFDALIFHGVEYRENANNNPSKRSSKQVYIYFNAETPFNTPRSLNFSRGFFNWTLSYRSDADIYRPYGVTIQRNITYKYPTIEEIKKRKKNKIAWFSSHCGVSSKRDELAKKLNKYMAVDIYGKCGNYVCDKDKRGECYDMMEHNYKFYLSFENSVCQDYVTEKLFSVLQKNVVPIVYGGADYDLVAPPYSIIDVTKYKTVKELADYLKFLDKNPKEYLKYFDWKGKYIIDSSHESTLCQLCEKLNEPREIKFYDDVVKWLNTPGLCKSGKELPSVVLR